jgi:DNA (cytosine-5)-methyltransferase 1
MTHLDLFSGIGGFALAVDRVWSGVEHIFCDNDLFCQEVLRKHWSNSFIYGDIRTITDTTSDRRTREGATTSIQEGHQEESKQSGELAWRFERPYILTGGFPCQPFSQAGRRRGTEDDRYLWPEMFRVIQLTKPAWIIAENVSGFVTWGGGMVLEQVCLDLENEGYEVQPFIIPAVAKNAPHRRDRVWIVAHLNSEGLQGSKETGDTGKSRETTEQRSGEQNNINVKNSVSKRGGGRLESNRQILERQSSQVKNERSGWGENWIEVATRLCRVDDGIPRRMDRTPRLKALGNAIVSQVAEVIMKAIKQIYD